MARSSTGGGVLDSDGVDADEVDVGVDGTRCEDELTLESLKVGWLLVHRIDCMCIVVQDCIAISCLASSLLSPYTHPIQYSMCSLL